MSTSHKPIGQQVIVVTGASSGIGLAIAEAAAQEGAKVVLAARSERTLQEIADRINREGGSAIAVCADVSNRSDVTAIAAAATSTYGRIDTWVNDAGVCIYGRLDETAEADTRRLFDVNFWGVVNGSLVALPHLAESHGTLINVGSEVSEAIIPLQGMYTASKHAVMAFTDTLRVEVEEMGRLPVSITLIQPTAVDTPFPQHARNYMDKEPKLPRPLIDPEKVAAAVLRAATHHSRDVKVGAGAVLETAVSKILPAMADRMSAKHASQQQYDAPPLHPEGTLNRPGESGQKRGRKLDGRRTSAFAFRPR